MEEIDWDNLEREFDALEAEVEAARKDERSVIEEAKERGHWESDAERVKALEEATNNYIKAHIGARASVEFYGGPYHGEVKSLRKPFVKVNEVAGPPKEHSPGCFSFEVPYYTYYLRAANNKLYYVEETKLHEFAQENYPG